MVASILSPSHSFHDLSPPYLIPALLHLLTSSLLHYLTLSFCTPHSLTPSLLHTSLRIPLHNTVWLTLLDQVNGADPAVFQAVTLALYFLVVDDGELEGRGGGSERGGGRGQ